MYTQLPMFGLVATFVICLVEHCSKGLCFYSNATEVIATNTCTIQGPLSSSSFMFSLQVLIRIVYVAIGAGTIISSQEIQRVLSLLQCCSIFSICRRVDWFDGQKLTITLDIQLRSIWTFIINNIITILTFRFN
jgi:hypothetical protein